MRRLLYVPIVHDEADLGSAGAALAQESVRRVGEQRWARHQETLDHFWKQVAAFFGAVDPRQLKVYQDGLPIAGEAARRIIAAAAARGSRNYQLVLELVNRGAELRQTEAAPLLWQERQHLQRLLSPSAEESEENAQPSPRPGERLVEERDRLIAATINATLREGEVGVLFIGAYHEVTPHLAPDITVEAVKDLRKVRAYFEALFGDREEGRLAELARYLGSPIGEEDPERAPRR